MKSSWSSTGAFLVDAGECSRTLRLSHEAGVPVRSLHLNSTDALFLPHRGRTQRRPHVAAVMVASLVAPPDADAARRGRDARAAGRGAALPGGDRLGLLVSARRGSGTCPGIGQARRRIRAAAGAPAAAGTAGTAHARRARCVQSRDRRHRIHQPRGVTGQPVSRAAGRDMDRRPSSRQGQLCGAQRPSGTATRDRGSAAAGRYREQLRVGARTPPAGVLATAGRQRSPPDAAASHSAVRSGPVRGDAARRVLHRRLAALRHACRSLGPLCRLSARRQGRTHRRQHGCQSARRPQSAPALDSANQRVRSARVACRQCVAASRTSLSHIAGRRRQWTVLAGGCTQRAHELDAHRHLAASHWAAAAAYAAGAGGRNQFPPRDGELHADRHARARSGGPHHLCQRSLLRNDGLERKRARRPDAALPLLAGIRSRSHERAARGRACYRAACRGKAVSRCG